MSQPSQLIQPSGILDSARGSQLRQEITAAIEAGAKAVLVDLMNVTFMDSSGLGALVSSLKTARAAGAELYVCSVTDQVKMLFELTHMDRVFNIVADQAEFQTKILAVE
jgi:anti-sigma B factor antagonist